MHNRFWAILFLISLQISVQGQEKLELSSAVYHSFTKARTLDLLNEPQLKSEFLNDLDTVAHQLFNKSLNYPAGFKFKTDPPNATVIYSETPGFKKKDLNTKDKTNYYLSFALSERPLATEMPIRDIDSNFVNELAKKKNVCIYQFNAKIINSDESVILEKQLFVLLARPDNAYFLGFEHPGYMVGTIGLSKIIKTCLPILLDNSNEAELIQIAALPAYTPDNFILPLVGNSAKTFTNIKQNFVQYNCRNELQSIRFQEPAYQPIVLKGKNSTSLPVEIQTAIRYDKRDYIFLWEESRDVYEDKNYKLATIATVVEDPNDPIRTPWFNLKTGLPLQFLRGNYHYLIQNKDTIGKFNIQLQVSDTAKKVFYNQLLNTKDLQAINLSNDLQPIRHVYHFVLSGTLEKKPFKVLISGINGSSSIKEIYLNGVLVCIAQGSIYPEILSILDKNISPQNLNQLLILAFSKLF